MSRKRYLPQDALDEYERIRDGVSLAELFNNPKHSKTLEYWVAGQFSIGYARCFEQRECYVWIADIDAQRDFDFELEVDGKCFPFQSTEALEPGRRRGSEYQDDDQPRTVTEGWLPGTLNGPAWVRQVIQKKIDKKYAAQHKLNLVVYVNIRAYSFDFDTIQAHCADLAKQFASTWLITGDSLCCISENPELGPVNGWYTFTRYPS